MSTPQQPAHTGFEPGTFWSWVTDPMRVTTEWGLHWIYMYLGVLSLWCLLRTRLQFILKSQTICRDTGSCGQYRTRQPDDISCRKTKGWKWDFPTGVIRLLCMVAIEAFPLGQIGEYHVVKSQTLHACDNRHVCVCVCVWSVHIYVTRGGGGGLLPCGINNWAWSSLYIYLYHIMMISVMAAVVS